MKWCVAAAGVHFDSEVREPDEAVEAGLVRLRRFRPIGDHGNDGGEMPRAELPQVEVADPVALDLNPVSDALDESASGTASSRTRAEDRTRPQDQRAITAAPTIPINGSIQVQP